MEGADARDVLQGVITTDIDKLGPERALYAALLTPQGKYLFDFFLLDGGDRLLIDVKADQAIPLARKLSTYCLRRDAKLVSGPPWQIAQVWGRTPEGGEICLQDPRDAGLGCRFYAPDVVASLSAQGARVAGPDTLTALRIAHRVPETGIELVPDDTYVLEAEFERLHGVDFRKGCYVGQEVTARMKHKTELRKRLVPVRVSEAVPPGTPVTAEGKAVGTLFSNLEGKGLAHLRLDRAGPGMSAGDATVDYEG